MPLADLRSRVRKDPLGVTLYNQLLSNTSWLSNFLAAEHQLDNGLHNAAEIPMVAASFHWTGATYTLEGGENGTATIAFDSNPAVGTVKLLTTGLTFADPGAAIKDQIAVEVRSSSETGLTAPVVAGYEIGSGADTGYIFVYLQTGDATTGVWTAEDGNFDIRIFSTPLASGTALDLGTPSLRGQGLFASRWNNLVAGLGAIYGRYNLFHNVSTGAHDVRTVPKAEGLIICQGTSYSVDSGSNVASVTRTAKGHLQVTFTNALTTSLQVFPEVYEASFSATQATLICSPRSTHLSATVDFYIYNFGDYGSHVGPPPYPWSWQLVDASFAFSVHGT